MSTKTKYHKHKGVESKGKLKSHPIDRQHKDKKVQKWHNQALGKTNAKKVKNVFKRHKREETLSIDMEGYIALDLSKIKAKGLRIIGLKAGKVWFASNGDVKGVQFDK